MEYNDISSYSETKIENGFVVLRTKNDSDILVNKKPFDDKSLENIINQIIDHHELSLGGGV